MERCYQRACQLLRDHQDKLTAVAEALLERDTLNRAEFEAVMNGEELPPMTEAEQLQPDPSVEPSSEQESARVVIDRTLAQLEAEYERLQQEEDDGEAFVEPDEKK